MLITLLRFPIINETARGSSINEAVMILPAPSYQGISLKIFIVIGLVDISKSLITEIYQEVKKARTSFLSYPSFIDIIGNI